METFANWGCYPDTSPPSPNSFGVRYRSVCSFPGGNYRYVTNLLTAGMVEILGGYEQGATNYLFLPSYPTVPYPNVVDPENAPVDTGQVPGTPADPFVYIRLDVLGTEKYELFMNALKNRVLSMNNVSIAINKYASSTEEQIQYYGSGIGAIMFLESDSIDYYTQKYEKESQFKFSLEVLELNYTGSTLNIDCTDVRSACSEQLSKMCITGITDVGLSGGSKRVCPSDCPGNGCIDWGTGYVEFKNLTKKVNNGVSGSVLQRIENNMLRDYVKLYNISTDNTSDVNCWLNCMNTSKCIGYKLDTNYCTLYSSMQVLSEPSNDHIEWMCDVDPGVGKKCSYIGMITRAQKGVSGSIGQYQFQPDPGCEAYRCGENVDHMYTAAPTQAPTLAPTGSPTYAPTGSPTHAPTASPVKRPTQAPTLAPITVIEPQVYLPEQPLIIDKDSLGDYCCYSDVPDIVDGVIQFRSPFNSSNRLRYQRIIDFTKGITLTMELKSYQTLGGTFITCLNNVFNNIPPGDYSMDVIVKPGYVEINFSGEKISYSYLSGDYNTLTFIANISKKEMYLIVNRDIVAIVNIQKYYSIYPSPWSYGLEFGGWASNQDLKYLKLYNEAQNVLDYANSMAIRPKPPQPQLETSCSKLTGVGICNFSMHILDMYTICMNSGDEGNVIARNEESPYSGKVSWRLEPVSSDTGDTYHIVNIQTGHRMWIGGYYTASDGQTEAEVKSTSSGFPGSSKCIDEFRLLNADGWDYRYGFRVYIAPLGDTSCIEDVCTRLNNTISDPQKNSKTNYFLQSRNGKIVVRLDKQFFYIYATPPVCVPSKRVKLCVGPNTSSSRWRIYGYRVFPRRVVSREKWPDSDDLYGKGRPLFIDSKKRVCYGNDSTVPSEFTFVQSDKWDWMFMSCTSSSSLEKVYLKYNFLNDHVRMDENWKDYSYYFKLDALSDSGYPGYFYIRTYCSGNCYIPNEQCLKLDMDSDLLEGARGWKIDGDYLASIFRFERV